MGRWFAAFVGVALALAACDSRPSPTIHDPAFVRAANQLCADRLPKLRAEKKTTDIFGTTDKNDRAKTADRIEQAADGLDRVSEELGTIPVKSVRDQGAVAAWLEEWANYTGIGRQYAAAVRTQRASVYTSIATTAEASVHRIAKFARANRIDSCVL